MALKDWKKYTSGIGDSLFLYKNIKNDLWINISHVKRDYTEFYSVKITDTTKGLGPSSKHVYTKNVKTKSAALKYAKSYMRKH